jgi:hypothetical protein
MPFVVTVCPAYGDVVVAVSDFLPWITSIATFAAGRLTVRLMLVVATPDSVSVTFTGSEYVFEVLLVAVVENEKTLSPGVTSPFVPSS